jgi:protein-disulfide isomerase
MAKKRRNPYLTTSQQNTIKKNTKENKVKKILFFSTIGVVVVIIGALVTVNILLSQKDQPTEGKWEESLGQLSNIANPKNSSGDGGIVVSPDGSTLTAINNNVPTVEVIMDPICPACGQLERTQGEYFEKMTKENKINLIIHPVALMDSGNTTYAKDQYSTRAVSAIAYVATQATDKLLDFISVLYSEKNQPSEAGYQPVADSFFVDLAVEAGIDQSIAAQLANKEYVPWSDVVTQAFRYGPKYYDQNQVLSTPQVWVNGTRIDPNAIEQAVDEVQAQINAQLSPTDSASAGSSSSNSSETNSAAPEKTPSPSE